MSDNIVSLEQTRREVQAAANLAPDAPVPEFIKPRGLSDMTDMEQDAYLIALRDRRLAATRKLVEAKEAKAQLANLSARMKIEKKIAQVDKAAVKAQEVHDKLEQLIFDLRALILQAE